MRHVEANGLKFAYLEEGTGPLVLLLHGFPDTAHTWDAVRPALAKAGWRAVSPFMRGYFPTEIPADGRYDGDTLGADVAALIPALGAERAVVVGHDWGASAAYAAAHLAPERISFLVTVAIPHPMVLKPTPRIMWGARHMLRFRLFDSTAKVRAKDFAHIDELWHRWSPGWDVPAKETEAVKEALRQPGSLEAALGYYRALGVRPSPSQRHRVNIPSAVFAPQNDGILTPAHYQRATRMYTAAHEIVSVPGGHFTHRQHPDVFEKELLRVLAASGGRATVPAP